MESCQVLNEAFTKLAGTLAVTEEMNADRRVRALHNASIIIPCILLSVYLFNPTGTTLGFNTCMLNSLLYIVLITRAEVCLTF